MCVNWKVLREILNIWWKFSAQSEKKNIKLNHKSLMCRKSIWILKCFCISRVNIEFKFDYNPMLKGTESIFATRTSSLLQLETAETELKLFFHWGFSHIFPTSFQTLLNRETEIAFGFHTCNWKWNQCQIEQK